MAITLEEAERLIEERFNEYPQFAAVIRDVSFNEILADILEIKGVDSSLQPLIENEIRIVLALYAPLQELSQNIEESTGLPKEKAEEITTLIENTILQPVYHDLFAFSVLWSEQLNKESNIPKVSSETREKLDLRPEGVPRSTGTPTGENNAKPLTREEVLRSLAPRRTMADDIASMNPKNADATEGYEAYQNRIKK